MSPTHHAQTSSSAPSPQNNLANTSPEQHREAPSLLTLPGELRNQIYTLALHHSENAGFIAPVHSTWEQMSKDQRIETILEGERRYLMTKKAYREDANGKLHVITQPCYDTDIMSPEIHDFHGHICGAACLLQPGLTRVCRQLRDEALPVFYGVNRFHLETATFYNEHEKPHAGSQVPFRTSDPSIGTDSPHVTVTRRRNPRDWWRSIGDSNLRSITRLRIIDRNAVRILIEVPDVELLVERYGQVSKADVLVKTRRRAYPGAFPKDTLEPATDTDVIEAKEQMAIDGPFVRGIERALLRHRILGITAVDWPAVATRPKGAVKISDVPGFGETWAYLPGDGEE